MKNKERLHKILDLKGLLIQPINTTMTNVAVATGKKKNGHIKCITDDKIAEGLIDATGNLDKGLIGFMIFAPQSEVMKMYEEEK